MLMLLVVGDKVLEFDIKIDRIRYGSHGNDGHERVLYGPEATFYIRGLVENLGLPALGSPSGTLRQNTDDGLLCSIRARCRVRGNRPRLRANF